MFTRQGVHSVSHTIKSQFRPTGRGYMREMSDADRLRDANTALTTMGIVLVLGVVLVGCFSGGPGVCLDSWTALTVSSFIT